MKISWDEVRFLEDFIQRLEDGAETQFPAETGTWPFFAEHPHFLMTMGFDEYVAFQNRRQFANLWIAAHASDTQQSIYRTPSGQWLMLYGSPHDLDGHFEFHSKSSVDHDFKYEKTISLHSLFDRLYDIADTWAPDSKTLWHPKLWTPQSQSVEKSLLQSSIQHVLSELTGEQKTLAELSWHQLEELVAEILRFNGLEIHLVRETPQGGRDIVARGELIPGQEPITMAVEVKHRKVVDRPEVQKALWQNREYPALLFITSGRFTSGVIEEKSLSENRLRLFLKDGEALGDMIRDYSYVSSPQSHPKNGITNR